MNMSQMMLPEFDQEMASTRRALERLPEERLAWKPHDKSFTLGRLASHITELVGWGASIMTSTEFDLAPKGGPERKPADFKSRQELLDAFDSGVKAFRAALAAASDQSFVETWALKRGGQTLFAMPRAAMIRGMVFNHCVHHRGQLTVYFRLTGTPVPALYGPSGDESPF